MTDLSVTLSIPQYLYDQAHIMTIAEMNPLVPRLALPLMRAIGKAPHVLCFDGNALQAAIVRQGLEILAVERHGTRGKDIRVFIVARKPT